MPRAPSSSWAPGLRLAQQHHRLTAWPGRERGREGVGPSCGDGADRPQPALIDGRAADHPAPAFHPRPRRHHALGAQPHEQRRDRRRGWAKGAGGVLDAVRGSRETGSGRGLVEVHVGGPCTHGRPHHDRAVVVAEQRRDSRARARGPEPLDGQFAPAGRQRPRPHRAAGRPGGEGVAAVVERDGRARWGRDRGGDEPRRTGRAAEPALHFEREGGAVPAEYGEVAEIGACEHGPGHPRARLGKGRERPAREALDDERVARTARVGPGDRDQPLGSAGDVERPGGGERQGRGGRGAGGDRVDPRAGAAGAGRSGSPDDGPEAGRVRGRVGREDQVRRGRC